jgi:hypothetical protein
MWAAGHRAGTHRPRGVYVPERRLLPMIAIAPRRTPSGLVEERVRAATYHQDDFRQRVPS